jgi:hypothetical protein
MRDDFFGRPLHARRWDPRWNWCELAVLGALLAGLQGR